ncbi:unnamed protein product [Rotaria sp. Silwood1]|nr:unnamed protein product [Rotaria sp. Silwood1]
MYDKDHFEAGVWSCRYYQYNKWHGPYHLSLSFDHLTSKVSGQGIDDVGIFTIDGVFSSQTHRMDLIKTYERDTGNSNENIEHQVTLQLTWNSDHNQFEGKWFVRTNYFPIQLHKTCDLPADRSYIFGYHPHGIISLGAFCNFATEATGFEEKFPGIDLRLLTLKSNFRIPFFGFYLSLLGLCDASKESCNYILEKGNGNSLMLVLGGVKEILDARPSSEYILTLKNRKGFVKIGLAHGASIVPVFSFGENDLYEQLANPRGSKLRQLQVMLQKKTGYTIPFFKGRGIFQYAFGFLPNRRPIDTYVGEPIELPKLSREEITNEIIDKYHTQYMDALTRLFDAHKAKHGNKDATIKYVNADDY